MCCGSVGSCPAAHRVFRAVHTVWLNKGLIRAALNGSIAAFCRVELLACGHGRNYIISGHCMVSNWQQIAENVRKL